MARPKKLKNVTYELIGQDDVIGRPMYTLLYRLIDAHHPDLSEARIALAWNLAWKPDCDGRVTLGKCKKASDLDRELSDFDFIILLRRSFWRDERVSDLQRTALLDHELHHAALKYDDKGDPVEDVRGRRVYRIRKHDLEEFVAVVERYGCYLSDIERFAAALRKAGVPSWQPCEQCQETPGWVSVINLYGNPLLQRCPCWTAYQAQRAELVAAS